MRELLCVGTGYKAPDSHKWGPGRRDVYSLHYVLSGRGYVEVDGKVIAVEAGQSFLIFPVEQYYYYPDERDPWEYVWIDFYGSQVEHLLSFTDFRKDSPVVTPSEKVQEFFDVKVDDANHIRKKEQETAKLHFLLTCFFRDRVVLAPDRKKEYLKVANEYISNSYWRSDFGIADVSDAMHIDRTYLYRLFKEEYGVSPLTYLTKYRIEKACELLRETTMEIQIIAASVGYEDALYFSKKFRKVKGTSPSAYRKRQTP